MTKADVLGRWHKIHRWLPRFRRGAPTPRNLVRLCRRRQEFISIINGAIHSASPWSSELINQVVGNILEGGDTELSVYEAATTDPFDHGHALAVVAEGISQDSFRAGARNRARGCTRGTLLIPAVYIPQSIRRRYSPENNLNFYPANERHFDLCLGNAEADIEQVQNEKKPFTLG
jgi:hypothetical protein